MPIMSKLCRNYDRMIFFAFGNFLFLYLKSDIIMSIEFKSQNFVRFFSHLCFIISILLIFRYFSLLRPIAKDAFYKEYLSALFMLIMLYTNYLYIIPHYFLKRKYATFLLLSLASVFLAALFEMLLVTSDIKVNLPSSFNEQQKILHTFVHFFLLVGRNMAFMFFFFVLKIFENEIQTHKKEQLLLAKSKGYIAVSTKEGMKYISVSEIHYVNQDKNYCNIFTFDGNKYDKYISLLKMSEYLPENQFIKINRNVIVNILGILSCTGDTLNLYDKRSEQELIFPLSKKYIANINDFRKLAVGLNDKNVGLNTEKNDEKDSLNQINQEENMQEKIDLESFQGIVGTDKDLKIICQMVAKDPSTNMKKMAEQLGVSQRTVERKMKQLKELNIIQHEGARKTGGYSLNPNITEEAKEWLLK